MTSRTDLIKMALQHVKAVAAGQPVSAEDNQLVSDRLAGIFAELAAREICYVPDLDDVPDEWAEALSLIVAKHVAPAFGLAGSELSDIVALAGDAEGRLRVMTRKNGTGRPLGIDPALRSRRLAGTWRS